MIEPEDVLREINEDRSVSGFPEVKLEHIEAELREQQRYYTDTIKTALNRFLQIDWLMSSPVLSRPPPIPGKNMAHRLLAESTWLSDTKRMPTVIISNQKQKT